MRKFINKLTGGEMWVADSREKEYLEAGHKPASFTEKPTASCATSHETAEESEKHEVEEKPKPAVKPKPKPKRRK